jgi:fucose-1-phosphate guanylyltransferase
VIQPMGSNPDDSYIKKTNNVSSISKSLFDMRKALFALLKNTPFTAVCCSPSRFYHIGTMEEYLNHYNSKAFLDDINGTSTVFSVLPSE